jgi:cyclophilin family peptidyl-prolyl cis-trans isomerase
MKRFTKILLALVFVLPLAAFAKEPAKADQPVVRMTTNLGVIEIALDAQHAPGTVTNFLHYVKSGFYRGTVFHRVIPGFMIQGGGFRPGMDEKAHDAPIHNEADNGLKNAAGTIAMARTPDPHSAAAQFFINTVDNPNLDYRDKTSAGWGYCVFGKVTKGMDVVHQIEHVATRNVGPFQNVPVKDVVIEQVELIKK